MSDALWRLLVGGHTVGPLSGDEVRASLANGSADPSTLVHAGARSTRSASPRGRRSASTRAASLTGRSGEGPALDASGIGRILTGG